MIDNAWLMLTFGRERSHGGNAGYADDPERSYRYDSLVQNARSIAGGDLIVLRDREAMLGFAMVEEIISQPAQKPLRRCPSCRTTKITERHSRVPRFRCAQKHEFDEPITEDKECTAYEARFAGTFHPARGVLSLADLRALCLKYTGQLSIQRMDRAALLRALAAKGHQLEIGTSDPRLVTLGVAYRVAEQTAVAADREPFEVDPKVIERGNHGHATTQNALAAFLRARGLEPRSPGVDEPDYDLAWSNGQRIVVAEVKSLTESNEEKQLRLGLGQVLRYRQVLRRKHREVAAVLVVEREPRDATWSGLCSDVGVILVWPNAFERTMVDGVGESANHSV